jgi:NDP-sugar pyrophosphorylase family protein
VNEDLPLGTGGALGLISKPNETVLVINGDILTQVDFRAMWIYHRENSADMTVAVRRYDVYVPYGVIECEDARVIKLNEKPEVHFLVNAGIYLLEPDVFDFIPNGHSFNMTELIQWLIDAKRCVVSFPIHEYWLDIGKHEDYDRAQTDMNEGKLIS